MSTGSGAGTRGAQGAPRAPGNAGGSAAGGSAGADDARIVRSVLGGDREAYRALVERYETVLFRRALALLDDRDRAADAVQDCFIRAYRNLGSCSDPRRFGGWVYRMLRNACLDELRSPRSRVIPLRPGSIRADHDPAVDLERSEIRDAVRGALSSLSPVLREAFVLKHVEGLSYDEIQEETGASRSALKMRVKRAREELERTLAPLVRDTKDPETQDREADVTGERPHTSTGVSSPEPSSRES